MARQRKVRQTQKTMLIIVEGATEKAFIGHLKDLYVPRQCGLAVKIDNAKCGGPDSIFAYTLKAIKAVPRDCNVVVMDTDREWSVKLRSEASKKKITLCGASPCIDGLLLRILGKNVANSSSECKRQFEANYLDAKKKLDKRNYSSVLPKDLIEKARKKFAELDEIITVLERR